MDRHLLAEEIDLLIDGEAGFGVAPLKAHVRQCAECQSDLEIARAVALELDLLPHFAPAPMFADRVMQQVQVFEPWHVAARDAARRLVPRSTPARVLAAAGGLTFATVFSLVAVWVLARIDVLALVSGMALERSQAVARGALGEFARTLLGDTAASMGLGTLALALAAFLVTAVGATAGLRAAAASARRQG